MLAPILLAAATTLSPADAWAAKTCPPPKAANSDLEALKREQRRLGCLRDAMNTELDRVIVPLAKKAPAEKHAWMKVQAQFNRFTKELCQLEEDVTWIDPETGVRSEGSGGGWTAVKCEERLVSWRALYAIDQRRAAKELGKFLRSFVDDGAAHRKTFTERFESLTEYQSAPPKPSEAPATGAILTARDWTALHDRLAKIASDIGAMSDAQCLLSRDALAKGCEETMSDALFSLVELDWASDH